MTPKFTKRTPAAFGGSGVMRGHARSHARQGLRVPRSFGKSCPGPSPKPTDPPVCHIIVGCRVWGTGAQAAGRRVQGAERMQGAGRRARSAVRGPRGAGRGAWGACQAQGAGREARARPGSMEGAGRGAQGAGAGRRVQGAGMQGTGRGSPRRQGAVTKKMSLLCVFVVTYCHGALCVD